MNINKRILQHQEKINQIKVKIETRKDFIEKFPQRAASNLSAIELLEISKKNEERKLAILNDRLQKETENINEINQYLTGGDYSYLPKKYIFEHLRNSLAHGNIVFNPYNYNLHFTDYDNNGILSCEIKTNLFVFMRKLCSMYFIEHNVLNNNSFELLESGNNYKTTK